ncbi:MAG: protein-glutamate O-methyltransferase CheR, partial [Thermoplasmata archaeon]
MPDKEEDFIKIKKEILKEKGLDLNKYKDNYLKRRIAVRMRSLQINTYREYLNILK